MEFEYYRNRRTWTTKYDKAVTYRVAAPRQQPGYTTIIPIIDDFAMFDKFMEDVRLLTRSHMQTDEYNMDANRLGLKKSLRRDCDLRLKQSNSWLETMPKDRRLCL